MPWCYHHGDEGYHVYDAEGRDVCHIIDTEREVAEIMIHAANHIIEARDIVRRLAELGSIGDRALLYQLAEDAAKLWDKMQREDKSDE